MERSALFVLLAVLLAAVAVPVPCGSAPLMVEKNLFSQDRKPPSPETTASAPQSNKPAVSPKAFQLDGIIIYGDTKKALVRLKAGGVPPGGKGKGQSPYVVVNEGGQIGEYRVTKVELKSITLEKDGQVIVVNLFSEGKVSTPAPAAPAPYKPPAEGQPPPGMPGQGRGRPPGAPGAGNAGDAAAANQNVNGPGMDASNPASMQPGQQGAGNAEANAPEEEVQGTDEPVDEGGP
jgi:hypothetical protein